MSQPDDSLVARKTQPRDIIKMALMFAGTALVVYVLINKLAGFDQLSRAVRTADWHLLPATGALLVVFILLAGIRWRYIVHTMGFFVPFKRTMSVILASCPLAIVTPSRISDFLRAVGIRDIVPLAEGSGSVLVHKFVDVQSLCILGIIGGVMTGLYQWSLIITGALVAGFAALGIIGWKRSFFLSLPLLNRFERKFVQLFRAFGAMRQRPWRYAVLSFISLTAWSIALCILYTLTEIFGAHVAFADIVAIWPIAVFVGLLPLTVGGMGTRDSAFIALLGLVSGATVHQAPLVAATLSYGLTVLGVPALVGIPFMLRFMHRLPQPVAEQASE